VTKYIRYKSGAETLYGILDRETVHELHGDLFHHSQTGKTHLLRDVTLLAPCVPPKILAVGLNYRSHLGNRPAPTSPEIFYKPVSCLQDPERPILIPPDAVNVHSEGELVVVIGKQARNVSPEQARAAIFGVTCGNDVSDRDWQHGANKDLQWWRAKGSDTFGPLGPCIVTGLDPSSLLLETRINGETVQRQSTSDLMFDCPAIISYISRLNPAT
jgi:2-keto-4-pentenoate hydratase/2-oxohepta-3-ene-1,7-dioic acid hydratase in catechol pathway